MYKLPIEKSKGPWKKGKTDSYNSIKQVRETLDNEDNVIEFPTHESLDVPDFMKKSRPMGSLNKKGKKLNKEKQTQVPHSLLNLEAKKIKHKMQMDYSDRVGAAALDGNSKKLSLLKKEMINLGLSTQMYDDFEEKY